MLRFAEAFMPVSAGEFVYALAIKAAALRRWQRGNIRAEKRGQYRMGGDILCPSENYAACRVPAKKGRPDASGRPCN